MYSGLIMEMNKRGNLDQADLMRLQFRRHAAWNPNRFLILLPGKVDYMSITNIL